MAARGEVTVRAGTSNGIVMQLLAGTVPIDLTSVGTVQLWLRDKSGGTQMASNVASGTAGTVTIAAGAGGTVTWTPGTATLASGSAPYQGYFKVFVTASSYYFVPEDAELTVHVRETYG